MWNSLFEEETLAAGTYWSDRSPGLNGALTLYDQRTVHAFDIELTGDGTIAITPYTSITGKTWVNNGAKLSGFGKTDGPDGDGIQGVPMSLIPGNLIRFKVVVSSAEVVLSMGFTQK